MNVAEFFVRVTADASGVDQGVRQATSGLDRLGDLAKVAGGAMAGAFAVDKVLDFGKASVSAAMEAEGVWTDLQGSLQNAGVQFETVAGQIDSVVTAMQKTSTLGDEDVAATLQTLVSISGDYAGSLEQIQTVADFAAGANLSLSTAADLVGKAMAGNTGTLSRYGVVVKEGDDALALLQDRFKGMAENEAGTLQGQLMQMNNAWGDFQEAIGNALLAMGGSGSIIGTLTDGLRALTGFVERNQEAFTLLGQGVTLALRGIGELLQWWGTILTTAADIAEASVGAIIASFNRLAGIFRTVTEGVGTVTNAFADMWNKVVGNSFVPDMVDGIAEHFARLKGVMVDPATEGADTVGAAFQRLGMNATDAVADFALGSKTAFQDFVDSAIADLTRLAVRMAAMRIFETIVNPLGALARGAGLSMDIRGAAPGIPSASLAPTGPSASLAGSDPDLEMFASKIASRQRPMTPREFGQDAWWVDAISEAVLVGQSRGLRLARG